MDKKEFDQFMEWSEIHSEQQIMKQLVMECPEERLRGILIKLWDSSEVVGHFMENREEFADFLWRGQRSLRSEGKE